MIPKEIKTTPEAEQVVIAKADVNECKYIKKIHAQSLFKIDINSALNMFRNKVANSGGNLGEYNMVSSFSPSKSIYGISYLCSEMYIRSIKPVSK